MDMICPKCGAKNSEIQFMGPFCVNCYEISIKLPKPSEAKFTKCKRCGKMLFKGEWQAFDISKVVKNLFKKSKGEFDSVDYDPDRQKLVFKAIRGGTEKIVENPFPIEINVNICPDCSRMSGGYFEAIVQLRGDNRERLKQYGESLQKRLKEKTFVTKVDENKDGIDLYIGDSKVVLKDLNERHIPCVISRKLFGKKEGKLIYRTTYLIRL
jgi:nonsense-mediated mRNA decay protein 3